MKIKLRELKVHPENDQIYNLTTLNDLEKSLSKHGQMEPLAVTKNLTIISGHRRYAAMKNIGWDVCDIRFVKPENEVVSLIEHNRHRQKTTTDILNEARYLERELRNSVGRGRYAASKRSGYKKGERITMVVELSKRLGVGTTRLKQLLSISNYEPSLLKDIDAGKISVTRAYERIRQKHFKNKCENGSDSDKTSDLRTFLAKSDLSLHNLNLVIKETYPYCIELTDITEDRRTDLIEHLDFLRKLSFEESNFIRKRDELESMDVSHRELQEARKLLPSHNEVENLLKSDKAISKIIVSEVKNNNTDKRLWNILRTIIHDQTNTKYIGRGMSAFVGFNSKTGYRILGLLSLNSVSHSIKFRDEHIGWNTENKRLFRERLVEMRVCCPTQPFGFNCLGGKFLSLMVIDLVKLWEKKYNTKIIAITTSSLQEGISQYSGMKWWKRLGTTSGRMLIKPLEHEWGYWRNWYREHFRHLYDETIQQTSPNQMSFQEILKILKIEVRQYTHNYRRGLYIMPLYSNYRDFLNAKINEEALIPIDNDWFVWWMTKVKRRKHTLEEQNKLRFDIPFREKIEKIDMDSWLIAKGLG